MVGRTRLYQKTGSPLISGRSRRSPAPPWLWIVIAVVVVAVAVAAYLTFLR